MGTFIKLVFLLALIYIVAESIVDACGPIDPDPPPRPKPKPKPKPPQPNPTPSRRRRRRSSRRRRHCGPGPVRRDGNWGSWQPTSWDLTPCGNGYQTRHRYCDSPSPANDGAFCRGSNSQQRDCDECSLGLAGCEHLCENLQPPRMYKCRCHYGYRPSPTDLKRCVLHSCPPLIPPLNGEILPVSCKNRTMHNQTCVYKCNRGFKGIGLSSKKCVGGKWPQDGFHCQVSDCQPLRKPQNGEISPLDCTTMPLHGQSCSYQCNRGFKPIGSTNIICDDGHWNATGFYCSDVEPPSFGDTCPSPQSVTADVGRTSAKVSWGQVKATDNSYFNISAIASPKVTSPHVFHEGNHTVIYTATDASGNTNSCHFKVTVRVLRCPALLPPNNGKLENAACGNVYGRVCRLACNRGYHIKGSVERKCDKKNGTNTAYWTGNETSCEAIRCPSLDTPDNVIKSGYGCSGPDSSYSTPCFFTCITGYEAIGGAHKRTCLETRHWSGSQLQCRAINCRPLFIKSEGLDISPITCTNTSALTPYKSQCHFICKSGYQQYGPGIKTCSQFKTWTPIGNPSCKDISAPVFSNCPMNIAVTADRGTESAKVTWSHPNATDNSGLTPNITHYGKQSGEIFAAGKHNIRYIASDKSGNVGECKFTIFVSVLRCVPKLNAPTGGASKCSKSNQYGSECLFACYNGYKMTGSSQRVCEKDPATNLGFWTGNETKCDMVRCPRLVPPSHSIQSGCGGSFLDNTFGDKCLLYCDIGYQLVNGSTERICQANGTWSGEPPHCQVVRCKGLQPPLNGHMSPSSCQASPEYDTVCQFSCRRGYVLYGEPVVTCLSDRQWSKNTTMLCKDEENPSFGLTCPSDIKRYADKTKNYTTVSWPTVVATDNSGKKPNLSSSGVKSLYYHGKHEVVYNASDDAMNYKICKFHIIITVLRCQRQGPPVNGFSIGDCDNSYGSTCKFGCNDGYNLLGPDNVTCVKKPDQITGYWDKPFPVCKVRSCSSINAPEDGFIYPHTCTSFPSSGTTCHFECKNGYRSNGGVSQMHCGLDGKWNGTESSILKCLDVTPPVFMRCPTHIQASLGINSTALVNWTEPMALDNSNVVPNVTVAPPGIHSPFTFNKTTLVVYTAVDGNGNKRKCSFKVIITDELGPVVTYCPPDQNIVATQMKTLVTWNDPQFKDNSNDPLTIQCSHQSGTTFYWGTWNVHCLAYDKNPNNQPAVCQFTLVLKPKDCGDMKPPKNGAKACDDWMFGRMCTPFCNNQWDFAQPLLSSMWACGSSGKWFPSSRWPDCSKKYRPNSVRMAMYLHYYNGDCSAPETQMEIKQNFIKILNGSIFKEVCQDPSLRDKCKVENVKVTCAVVNTNDKGRRRRSTGISQYDRHGRVRRSIPRTEISVDIVVSLDGIKANSSEEGQVWIGEEGIKVAKNITSSLKSSVSNGSLSLTINGTIFTPNKQSLNISAPKRFCSSGQVYRDGYCLNCTTGTYFHNSTGTCNDCPVGTYQEFEAQENCSACPPQTSTTVTRTEQLSDCLALCQPGTYSPTGLEPCISCAKGFYQEIGGQRTCFNCGVNKTTSDEGSNSSMQCRVPCLPGSYSPTGLAPCTLCNRFSFQPRNESRSCFPCPGTTITNIYGSRNSQDCIEINECDSSPCSHDSTCIDLIGDFLCSCQPGYTGKQCVTNINDCEKQPCFNNGTCVDMVNNYTCSCAYGYRGYNCEEDIDECVSSPCANNASCVNLLGGFSCQCEPGYTGKLCNIDIDECLISPCQNGATCRDKINNYDCICVAGYRGYDCEENIDDCGSNPCLNGGQCLDQIAGYHCVCPSGFNGTECEFNIDDCVGASCKNNATCVDEISGFLCICEKGFSGKTCEVDIDECASGPCGNQGKCKDIVNGFHCDCSSGFDGLQCENNIDDCAASPCSNNGSCQDDVDKFTCICLAGFSGKMCEEDIDFCASTPCINNGSCFDGISSFTCQCADGFDGEQCQNNIDDCKNGNCLNNSTCIDGIDEYKCVCTNGFAGADCEIDIDDCGKNPCVNDGTCIDLVNDYLCICMGGYTGKNCSININECTSIPCRNNATCIDKVDNYTCACIDGFTGQQCGVNIDDCVFNSCSRGSTCRDGLDTYSCDCASGFTGEFCEVEIDECTSFPCYYGGKCYDKINGFVCVCPTGFTGTQCEANIDDCKHALCLNGGFCIDLVGNYSCLCPDGFLGSRCESQIDYCRNSNCSRNGYCVNSRTEFYCHCGRGYFGKYCEYEMNECLARPCFNNGTCFDAPNNFTCTCPEGYTGRLCDENIDDCVHNLCLNNATCIDRTLAYYCACLDGYNGTFCQTQINECESDPCKNNGTCIDLIPGHSCKCPEQFNGEICENPIDVCISSPCQHGGICKAQNFSEDFNCTCKPGFTGSTCEEDINDCISNPCVANAYCIDMVNDFRCECYPSYSGANCEIFLASTFDLIFKRQTTEDMIFLRDGKDIPSMTSFTIAQFVRADSRYTSGTLFSYSVPGNPNDIIILDFKESQLHLTIKDEIITANYKLADDKWHYVGVIWDGSLGSASIYIDGKGLKRMDGMKSDITVSGGGWIVLGQRYLAEEKTTSLKTAFVGTLHQVSIWNAPATPYHMWNAAHNCSWPIAGSLRAWNSFLPGIKGKVERSFMTKCKALDMCTTNCSHFLHCESRQGLYYCVCEAGFTGFHCDINIDECSSTPCVNGKCIDGVDSFECICNKGYYGNKCEKKVINEEECPEIEKPSNGKSTCRKVSGEKICIMSCNEGYSFSAEETSTYRCGPGTEWKWNGEDAVAIPTCLRKAAPREIKHRFSIDFPGMLCNGSQSHSELRSAIEKETSDTLSTIPGCQSCQVQEIEIPECQISENKRDRRAAKPVMRITFSLMVLRASNLTDDDVQEKSAAVLFQMQYAVATGQFTITLNGMDLKAGRSSLQLLSTSVVCDAGFVTSSDGKGCVACSTGTFHEEGSLRCTKCDKGSYQDKEGQDHCTACEEGKSTQNTGAYAKDDCFQDKHSITTYIVISVLALVGIIAVLLAYIRYRDHCSLFNRERDYELHDRIHATIPRGEDNPGLIGDVDL